MKTTIKIEMTSFQVAELAHLGEILWPGESLTMSEVCRRVLLDGADGMRAAEWRQGGRDPRHLLAHADLPCGGDGG